jgi:pimeloyl-ACP methyl ester carboxylesterase
MASARLTVLVADRSATIADGQATYGAAGRSAWLDIDWRAHQRWVILDGRPVNVIELGEGPPVVFVHGLSGAWQNWLEQLPQVACSHRVIAMDLPGFGYSPLPAQKISISGYTRMLDQLFDALAIDSAAVVGNSMGGFISAELAINFPERVKRLVLVSPAGISTEGRNVRLETLRRVERVTAAFAAWFASKSDIVACRARLRRLTLSVVAADPARLPAALAAEYLRGSGKPGFLDALEALVSYPLRARLPEIAAPTLVVWGDRDFLVPVRDADVFTELIPNSRKVVFKDTGHIAMSERPAAFNALLEEFLSE